MNIDTTRVQAVNGYGEFTNKTIKVINGKGKPVNKTISKVNSAPVNGELFLDRPEIEIQDYSSPVTMRQIIDNDLINKYGDDSGKIRCQVPSTFRESESWNGIIRNGQNGYPFLFDNGTGLKYLLTDIPTLLFNEVTPQNLPANDHDNSTTTGINKKYAFVLYESKDYVVEIENLKFFGIVAIRNYMANKYAYDKDGMAIGKMAKDGSFKHFKAFEVWLSDANRRTYSDVVFDPSKKEKHYQLNLYRGMSIKPAEGVHDLILSHIFFIWCKQDNDSYFYVIQWFARMVQMPWLQGQTILALKSNEGAGKGLIIDMFTQAIFKHHSTIATKKNDVLGKFNDKLATSIVVYLNEAVWGGDKEEQGTLKALSTDPTITMEKKYQPKVDVRNCTHIIISSNNDWFAPIDKTDRRFLVLMLDDSIIGNYSYFDALRYQINNGGTESFLHFLLNYDLTGFEPRNIPLINSDERTQLKMEGLSTTDKWIIGLPDTNKIFYADDEVLQSATSTHEEFNDWENNPIEILKFRLYEQYLDYCKGKRGEPLNLGSLTKQLIKILGVTATRESTKQRRYTYTFPSRMLCKDNIAKYLGGDRLDND